MPFYDAPTRAYWKITIDDLKNARNYDGINLPIDKCGPRWKDGPGIVSIPKGTKEWDYIFNHIAKLPRFLTKRENTSSVNIPKALSNCFIKKK